MEAYAGGLAVSTCDYLAAQLDAGICVSHELFPDSGQLPASVDADRNESYSGSQATCSRNEVYNPDQHTHDHQNLPAGYIHL